MRTRNHRFTGPVLGCLPRLIIYKPLATLLAILLAPAFSWIASGEVQQGASPFQAGAQTVGGCGSGTNTIIQNYCGVNNDLAGYNLYHNDLVQLESDSVNAYLAAHNLPATDALVIYEYGRADLRDAIRTYMMATLLGIISKPASSRSAHEQSLYNWLQGLVQQNEIALYTAAYNNYLSWQADPCNFTLDSTLAQAYNISYDGAPFCGNQLTNVYGSPSVPAPSYFLAYGLEQGYEQWGKQCPITNSCGQLPILPDMSAKLSEIISITIDAESVLASTLATALYANLTAAQAAFLAGFSQTPAIATGGNAAATSALVDGAVVDEVGIGGLVAVPVTIVLVAIAIGVGAGFQTFNNQEMLNQLNDLKNQITAAQNTPPDLNAFATDGSGLGLLKLENTLITQTLRTNLDGTLSDQPSTAPLPAHRSGTDLNFQHLSGQTSDTLSYLGWNGEAWTAQTWGGWFVQTCANGSKLNSQMTGTCAETDSISADLDFIDWSFFTWYETGGYEQARFTGSRFHDIDFLGNTRNKFTITRTGGNLVNGQSSIPTGSGSVTMQNCPAGAGGISPGPYTSSTSACWGYVSNQIPIVLANLTVAEGAFDLVNLVDGVSPAFAGPTNLAFAAGAASSQTITVSGTPTPSGCVSSTNLPNDFTVGGYTIPYLKQFGCNFPELKNSFEVFFDGNGRAVPGTYSLTVQFSNSAGTTLRTYSISLSSQLGIVSPGTMSVTPGIPASFTVVATGYPAPKLSVDRLFAQFLNGLSFQDNGNGTATISGTYDSLFAGTCTNVTPGPSGSNCGIIATTYNPNNTIKQQVEQQFAINVIPAAAATLATPGTTFTSGAPNQVVLSATGATTPVSWCFGNGQVNPFPLSCADTPPISWLSLHDNGNGTATLSGTPPVGTNGSVNVQIVPAAEYSYASSDNYTITFTDAPLFTSAGFTTFTVGSDGSFTVSSTEGTISLLNPLPAGLQFSSSGNSATISGTPAAGTGGQYTLSLAAKDGALGSATQDLLLNIDDAPQITSPPAATFFAGMPGSFSITTTGFPSTSSQPFSQSQPLATLAAMHFEGNGLPSSLTTSNLNSAGFLTGTLVISGTPQSADVGTYTYSFMANNGIGNPAYQDLAVRVLPFDPSTPINLLPQVGLSLDSNNDVVISVVLSNGGSAAAENVTVTSAKLTSAGGTITPAAIEPASAVSIPSASSATFNLVCPNTINFSARNVATYTISVSYSGGSLTFSGRTLII